MMGKDRLTAIVQAIQNGDELAVTDLYNEYHDDIYYYILKTLDRQNDPELAADLTQDTFIEIIQTIHKLQDPAAFAAWSRKIAYHKCTAYFRKRRELLADEQEDGSTIFDTLVEEREEFIPGEALDKEDLKRTIHEMIDSLPEEQRSAIMMRYFDELSVKQIAEIQGTTEGTVKSRLNYGRKSIKTAVEDYEKRHDVKLHCAGIVPILLWLFRQELLASGTTNAVLPSSTAPAAPAPAAPAPAASVQVPLAGAEAAGKAATVSAKVFTKIAAGKLIALIAAAAVAVTTLVIGISQLSTDSDSNHRNSSVNSFDTPSDQADPVILDVAAQKMCGFWVNGDDKLLITRRGESACFDFSYSPAEGERFDFFADFNTREMAVLVPVGSNCGYVEGLTKEGFIRYRWEKTNDPWRISYDENTLFWDLSHGSVLSFVREGTASEEEEKAPNFLLEDYPAYIQKVAEYRSAILSDTDVSDSNLYSTLNTNMLHSYYWYGRDRDFTYALEDIDSNGTPELLIGMDKSSIIDLYSLSGDTIVQYFENPTFGERGYLSILSGGMLSTGGSSSASSGGSAIFAISEDGTSVSIIAIYQYYIDDGGAPPPPGSYMSYEAYCAAVSQYKGYEGKIQWFSIVE